MVSQGANRARFPLAALVHRYTLISLRVRYGLCPCGTSPESAFHRLSPNNRSPGHCLPGAVSVSPNLALALCRRIGSKKGITPFSAHRSRTSPIRGMRLQRLLGIRWRPDACRGGAPTRPFGQYVCLQLAVCPKAPGSYHREPWDRPPCMRAPQLSLRFRTCTK